MNIFSSLLDILFPPRESQLLVRHAKEHDLLAFYRPQTLFMRQMIVTSLLPYRTSLVRACVMEAKFYGNAKAQRMLGMVLAQHLEHIAASARAVRCTPILVPVPLGPKRKQERGYNQVEAIAKQTVGAVPIAANVLMRTRDTLAQSTLDGQKRRENMRGVFMVAAPVDPTYLYIVVDDVLTTGSTLSAAARTLSSSTPGPICVLALAH